MRRTPLDDFSREIKNAFGDDPKPGWSLLCEDADNPRPADIKPRPGATPRKQPASSPFSSLSRATAHRQSRMLDDRPESGQTIKVVNYETDGEGLVFDPRYTRRDRHGKDRPYKVDSLRVTDRFLAARPGSEFTAGDDIVFTRYADDIAYGLHSIPDVDQNPYNFVPWLDEKPRLAERPCEGTHDKHHPARLSGSIHVALTACTPIFIPAPELAAAKEEGDTGEPRDFFHCWNGTQDRYAIPGSSVKGAVRSVFEALTNSRAGVTDTEEHKWPPLYRRRAFRLFRIVSMPTETVPGQVEECEYGLYDDRTGRRSPRTRNDLPEPNVGNDVEEREFAANLFFVAPYSGNRPNGHKHKWTTMRFRPLGRRLALDFGVVERFKCMKGHPHMRNHGGRQGNAAAAANCLYGRPGGTGSHAPAYSADIERKIFEIEKGALVFGIPDRGKLRCFGRNVNFLWPSDRSTSGLMGKFAERKPDDSDLANSDPAEAVFGFVGTHDGSSHPFQGRVRFGMFWGPNHCDGDLASRPSLSLMPLTSPSGSKAKSRPLYLTPGKNGKATDHDTHARLRGRKFYWHQRAKGNNKSDDVPPVHRLETMKRNVPSDWTSKIAKQLPAPIRPLPEKSVFEGRVHFINLTSSELGALLISLKPELAFESENKASDEAGQRYGLKIGKGKPRGLGSVTTTEMELRVACRPQDAYKSLDAPLTEVAADMEVRKHVQAYKRWITPNGGRWGDLDVVKALKALLRLPDGPSARVYPPQFAMYGWLPTPPSDRDADRAARGAPAGAYPKAMTPAVSVASPES